MSPLLAHIHEKKKKKEKGTIAFLFLVLLLKQAPLKRRHHANGLLVIGSHIQVLQNLVNLKKYYLLSIVFVFWLATDNFNIQ